MLIRNAEIAGIPGMDVRIDEGRIVACGHSLGRCSGADVLEANGGVLLPGLHDHHIHLRALAVAQASVSAGPPAVRDHRELATRLVEAIPQNGWIRAVGYHESVAGNLDRRRLDELVPDRPLRVQHRSGALWMLNSAAIRLTGLDSCPLPGVERDDTGRPTGRLWRMDAWVADRLRSSPPSLHEVSRRAAAAGVTGFTDATPDLTQADIDQLASATESGEVRQRIHCMAPPGRRAPAGHRFSLGPVKILLDDTTLPTVDELAARIRAAHQVGRPVAVHCVTYVQLLSTLTALDYAGTAVGDRIEHGALIPVDVLTEIRRLGIVVVTQPGFAVERGDQYLADVDSDELPDLWRLRSLADSGVLLAAGTDAPFGGADPWAAMSAATDRTTESGSHIGPDEELSARDALALFLGRPESPATRRTVTVGSPADLCLLSLPLQEAVDVLDSAMVSATLVGGDIVHSSACFE